jgi:hypothetical protein
MVPVVGDSIEFLIVERVIDSLEDVLNLESANFPLGFAFRLSLLLQSNTR